MCACACIHTHTCAHLDIHTVESYSSLKLEGTHVFCNMDLAGGHCSVK